MSGMRRREFVILLGGSAAAAWPLAAHAQQSNRLRVVGVLLAMAPDDPEAQLRVKAFEAGLRELGWTEGRNLRLDTAGRLATPPSCASRQPSWSASRRI